MKQAYLTLFDLYSTFHTGIDTFYRSQHIEQLSKDFHEEITSSPAGIFRLGNLLIMHSELCNIHDRVTNLR